MTISLAACQKTIDKKAENIIVTAMTDGQWVVTHFTVDSGDSSQLFGGYSFQFFDNYTVNGIKNSAIQATGTWQGDIGMMTITAGFQNASSPIVLLNGTWHIIESSWTIVVATMTAGSQTKTVRLEKQ
jgi:hypothetical protein